MRLGHISALASSTQFTTEMPLRYLKSAYPLYQTEEAVSNFETASFLLNKVDKSEEGFSSLFISLEHSGIGENLKEYLANLLFKNGSYIIL